MNRISFAKAIISGSAALAVISLGIAACARPPYPGILKKVYPKATLSCNACHDPAPPQLNKYGTSVKGVLAKSKTPKVLTVDEIKGLEKKGIRPESLKADGTPK